MTNRVSRGTRALTVLVAPAAAGFAAAGCASTGATVRSGPGDTFLEHPPRYADAPVSGEDGGKRSRRKHRGRSLRRTLCALLALAVAGPLHAQEAAPAAAALAGLRPGEVVRVRTATASVREGRFVSASPDSLVLRSEREGTLRIAPAAIDTAWTKGHATLLGGVVGAGVGLAASLAVSSAVCAAIDEGFLCGESGTAVALSTAGSAALGAAIGWTIRPWRVRYARGRTSSPRVEVGPGPAGSLFLRVAMLR